MKLNLVAKLTKRLQRLRNKYWPWAEIEKNCYLLSYHRLNLLDASPGEAAPVKDDEINDSELIKRIIKAYQRANKADLGDSMWKVFFSAYHQPIHQLLIDGNEDAVAKLFRDPQVSDLFYGFDLLTKSYQGAFRREKVRSAYAKLCLDGLVRFAESTNAIPLDNPETWPARIGDILETERILDMLNSVGVKFNVPNPFPNEHGLNSSRGIISYRVPQALYQAWRIKQLVKGIEHPRILEIGAGLGRTAYYVNALGMKDYTIVDIPITATSQAYYLGRTLGEGSLLLDGEEAVDESRKIKIISPQTFLSENKTYDLIVNVDSLSEMDVAVAQRYWKKTKNSTTLFLSINHEANAFRIHDLISEDLNQLDIHRGLYWMRRGYAEELIHIRST